MNAAASWDKATAKWHNGGVQEAYDHDTPKPEGFTVRERRVLAIYGLRNWFDTEIATLRELASRKPSPGSTREDRETGALKKRLTKEQRKKARQVAERLATMARETVDDVMGAMAASVETDAVAADPPETEGEWYWKPEELAVVVAQQAGRERIERPLKDALEAFDGDWDAFNYALRLVQHIHSGDSSESLRTALLVRLVAAFESMLAGFIRTWTLPRESTDLGKEMMRERLVTAARMANQVINGRWDRSRPWNEWLAEKANIDLLRIAPDAWETTHEVFARRNAFVHADGFADTRYRKRLEGTPGLAGLGTPLRCTEQYLTQALYACEVLADVLAVGVTTQVIGGGDWAAALAAEPVYRVVRREQWSAAEWMATTALEGLPMEHQFHELRVNRWLAQREQQGLSVIQVEVEAWQPEEARYRLAKAALLFDESEAIEVLRTWTPDPGEATSVSDWPLMRILSERSEAFGVYFRDWQRAASLRHQRQKPPQPRSMANGGRGKASLINSKTRRRRRS